MERANRIIPLRASAPQIKESILQVQIYLQIMLELKQTGIKISLNSCTTLSDFAENVTETFNLCVFINNEQDKKEKLI